MNGSPAHDSQVMSAIIKHVRLRRVDDAVYWLLHYIHYWPDQQERLTRRILILAGEDCIDPPVQTAVAEWVHKAFSEPDTKKWLQGAVSMLHLIAATEPWWRSDTGSKYIAAFLTGEKTIASMSEKDKSDALAAEMDWDNEESGFLMVQHMLRHGSTQGDVKGKSGYAFNLAEEARIRGNLAARIPASIHFRYGKALARDDNFIGQTVFRLAFGPLGKNEYPAITGEQVYESVLRARARLKKPEKTPKYVQDGIHCYGKDKRFAGVLPSMVGCCLAARVFNRLSPDDVWPDWFLHPNADQELLQLIAKGGK